MAPAHNITSQQCNVAAKQTNAISGYVSRSTVPGSFLSICISQATSGVLSPILGTNRTRKNIDKVGWAQRRATRMKELNLRWNS